MSPEPPAPASTTAMEAARAARSEYRWHNAGPTDVHGHVGRPLLLHLDRFNAGSVLDVGCGNGWFTAALARCGFEVCGLDISHSGIAIAQRSHPDLSFEQGDATVPPPPAMLGRYDAVVAIESVDHVAQPARLLAHARAALRPGGLLLVTVPYHGYLKNLGLALSDRFDLRLQAQEEHGRLKFFSRRTLVALVQDAGFEQVRTESLGRLPPIARSLLLVAHKPGAAGA